MAAAGRKLTFIGIDHMQIVKGSGILLSLFGHNKGSAQFVQLFDVAAAPSNGDEPLYAFKIAANDNFSVIVPLSGINFSYGLYVALSSTQGFYTAGGSKDVTFLGTLRA